MSMEVITLEEVSRAGLRLLSLSKIAAHETVPLGLDHLGVGSSIGDNSGTRTTERQNLINIFI